jgi:hypothetical protein
LGPSRGSDGMGRWISDVSLFVLLSLFSLLSHLRMSLPTPQFATAALHSDNQPHDINSNEPVAPSLEFSTTYRAIHPDSELAAQLSRDGYESLDFQHPPAHIYSRYTSDTRGRAEAVLSGLMVSDRPKIE